jgi:endonuclease/exonuclease/phosphatase family metal-dependent hydrolase
VTTTLSLLTLNLGLPAIRPFGLWQISFAAYIDERLAAAPVLLSAIKADVIALQEVYTAWHVRFLQEALRKSHPHIFVQRKLRSILGNGLMFLSRHPIRYGEFVPMRRARTIDNVLSEKGCLFIEVEAPNIGTLRLITVHLTAHESILRPKSRADATCDFAEIEHLLSVARTSNCAPGILLGDFNCSEVINPKKYQRIIEAGYMDAFAFLASPEVVRNGVTWDANNPVNTTGRHRNSPSQRIDHVFVPDALRNRIKPSASTIEFSTPTVATSNGQFITLSDHYGLLVRLAPD